MIDNTKNKISLGIDIGGTKISAGLVSKGKILKEIAKDKTPDKSNEIITKVFDIISKALKDDSINYIGIATAGVVDIESGEVLSATENLADSYIGINYKLLIEEKFKIKTIVDNDANAAAIGEHLYGSAKEYKNCIILTIGTGIGSGIIINNNIYRGTHYSAGECGHIIISTNDDRPCTCGKLGCWEAYASGNGLAKTAKEILNNENIDSYKVIKEVNNNNLKFIEIYNLWHKHLSYGLISLMNSFGPECIVIGGSMSEFIDYNTLHKLTIKKSPSYVDIKKAHFGNNAGIIGAASLAESFFN